MNLVNPNAESVRKLAHDLAQGYYSYSAAMTIAKDLRSDNLLPPIEPGQVVPVGYVKSKAGFNHVFHFSFYLEEARKNPSIIHHLDRIYFAGALLTLGDALSKYNYFDRAPILELVRHLRNGIAHGNTFDIRDSKTLIKHPANNKSFDGNAVFEITDTLNGQPVLFDFMEPGDIVTTFTNVNFHLQNVAWN